MAKLTIKNLLAKHLEAAQAAQEAAEAGKAFKLELHTGLHKPPPEPFPIPDLQAIEEMAGEMPAPKLDFSVPQAVLDELQAFGTPPPQLKPPQSQFKPKYHSGYHKYQPDYHIYEQPPYTYKPKYDPPVIPADMYRVYAPQLSRIDKARGDLSRAEFISAAIEDALYWKEPPAQAASG